MRQGRVPDGQQPEFAPLPNLEPPEHDDPARTAPATDATITRFMGKGPTVDQTRLVSDAQRAGWIFYTAAPGRLHRCMMHAAAIASRGVRGRDSGRAT